MLIIWHTGIYHVIFCFEYVKMLNKGQPNNRNICESKNQQMLQLKLSFPVERLNFDRKFVPMFMARVQTQSVVSSSRIGWCSFLWAFDLNFFHFHFNSLSNTAAFETLSAVPLPNNIASAFCSSALFSSSKNPHFCRTTDSLHTLC